jgi:hypothetical protein
MGHEAVCNSESKSSGSDIRHTQRRYQSTKEVAQSRRCIIQAVSIRKKQFAGRLNKKRIIPLLQNLGEIPGDAWMILGIISQSWLNQVMRVNFNSLTLSYHWWISQ